MILILQRVRRIMNNYQLSRMLNTRVSRKAVYFPILSPSISFEKAYLKLLRLIVDVAKWEIKNRVLPNYERQATLITDASISFNAFYLRLNELTTSIIGKLRVLLSVVADKHTDKWVAAAKSALSVDLRGIVSKEDLTDYIDKAAQRNAALIKGMADDLVKNVRVAVVNSVIAGDSHTTLKKKLKEVLIVSDNRARLIARDQTGKLNSDLTKIRHQQAGIEEYEWRTSEDERVRPRHQAIDGNRYEYGEPTGAENGLPPGQPIQCRCVARGIIKI